jgi:hypothetical protein
LQAPQLALQPQLATDRSASWITALKVLPSSRAVVSASSAKSGGREMVFFTAMAMAAHRLDWYEEILPTRQPSSTFTAWRYHASRAATGKSRP